MNINKFPGANGESSIPPMEPGTYSAVCCGVVDLGTHKEEWNGEVKTRDQLLLMFEIPSETIEINGEQKPRNLSMTLTKSMHEQSSLRKHLASWRGRDFTDDERKDFELSRILGVPATIGVVRSEKNGKHYANIKTITKAMKGVETKASRKLYFDLGDPDTYSAVQELPEWVIKKINQSAEAIAMKWVFAKDKDIPATAVVDDSGEDVPF